MVKHLTNSPDAVNLLAKIKEADSIFDSPCWEWQGNVSPEGYGRMYVNRRLVNVHRYAYTVFFGQEIPEGLVVRHICHNKRCINPDHLRIDTQAANMRDSIRTHSAIRKLKLDTDPIRLNQSTGEAIRADRPNQVSRIKRGKVWRAEA